MSLVIGPDGYRALPALIDGARRGERTIATTFDLEEHYEDFQPRRFDKVKAWIPVQRGCDYRCTYCIVPTTRGPERSRRLADVVREVEARRRRGNDGSRAARPDGELVPRRRVRFRRPAARGRRVSTAFGALRFTSPHPNDFSDRVIAAMAEVDAVCEHVHLPMQSGSTRVLKRMLRRYTREGYLECVAKLRAAIPGLTRDDGHHRRIPRRDRRGFRGDAERRARGRVRRRLHVQVLAARRHAGDAHAGRADGAGRGGERAARALVETIRGSARAREPARSSASATKCSSRRRRAAAAICSRRARATSRRCSFRATRACSGSTSHVELTGTTGSTFTGQIVPERQPLPMAAERKANGCHRRDAKVLMDASAGQCCCVVPATRISLRPLGKPALSA